MVSPGAVRLPLPPVTRLLRKLSGFVVIKQQMLFMIMIGDGSIEENTGGGQGRKLTTF